MAAGQLSGGDSDVLSCPSRSGAKGQGTNCGRHRCGGTASTAEPQGQGGSAPILRDTTGRVWPRAPEPRWDAEQTAGLLGSRMHRVWCWGAESHCTPGPEATGVACLCTLAGTRGTGRLCVD